MKSVFMTKNKYTLVTFFDCVIYGDMDKMQTKGRHKTLFVCGLDFEYLYMI